MYQQKSKVDLANLWSYGVLILTLALMVHAWTAAQSLAAPFTQQAHETEGSLSASFSTTESETPAFPSH